jgi:hypothetical protein
VPLHLVEQLLPHIVLLEQVAEATHRRLVGHRLAAEIDADKAAHRPGVLDLPGLPAAGGGIRQIAVPPAYGGNPVVIADAFA